MSDQNQNPSSSSQDTTVTDQKATQGTTPLEADLTAANKQIQELTETAKRALADLKNYRKKVEEERTNFIAFANIGLILELLPILDSFQRAFFHVPKEVEKTEWFKGAMQIEQQLVTLIRKQGVMEIPLSVDQKLDPRIHEAVATGPGEKDVITEEFEKGYMLNEKIIRPAKVKVGNGNQKIP